MPNSGFIAPLKLWEYRRFDLYQRDGDQKVAGEKDAYVDTKATLQEWEGFKTKGKSGAAGGGVKAGESCKPTPPPQSVFIKALMAEKMAAVTIRGKIATAASMVKTLGVCAAPMA